MSTIIEDRLYFIANELIQINRNIEKLTETLKEFLNWVKEQ